MPTKGGPGLSAYRAPARTELELRADSATVPTLDAGTVEVELGSLYFLEWHRSHGRFAHVAGAVVTELTVAPEDAKRLYQALWTHAALAGRVAPRRDRRWYLWALRRTLRDLFVTTPSGAIAVAFILLVGSGAAMMLRLLLSAFLPPTLALAIPVVIAGALMAWGIFEIVRKAARAATDSDYRPQRLGSMASDLERLQNPAPTPISLPFGHEAKTIYVDGDGRAVVGIRQAKDTLFRAPGDPPRAR